MSNPTTVVPWHPPSSYWQGMGEDLESPWKITGYGILVGFVVCSDAGGEGHAKNKPMMIYQRDSDHSCVSLRRDLKHEYRFTETFITLVCNA